jgi:hypothetical protein
MVGLVGVSAWRVSRVCLQGARVSLAGVSAWGQGVTCRGARVSLAGVPAWGQGVTCRCACRVLLAGVGVLWQHFKSLVSQSWCSVECEYTSQLALVNFMMIMHAL